MKVGIDMVHLPRAEKLMNSPDDLTRLFSTSELSYHTKRGISRERIGGLLALKEAYFKAVGKKGEWHSIEIGHELSGAPYIVVLQKESEKITSVSVSHDGEYVVAVVCLP